MRRSIKLTLLLLISSVFIVFGSIGGCSSGGGGGGKGCCIVGPDECVDDTKQSECDVLGGVLDKGVQCSVIPECGDVPPPTDPPPPPGDTLGAAPIAPEEAPESCDDPIWDEAVEISVDTENMNTGDLYGDGQLNMSGTLGGENDFNRGDDPNLKLAALYTTGGSDIYIRARWEDVIFNLDRRRALYNGPSDPDKADDPEGFTSQLNDDKIGFAFEIEPGTSSEFGTFEDVGCAASCHFVEADGGLDMRPETGKVDIWHQKTSRSEPVAYVNDQFSEPVDGRQTDAGVGIEARNRAGGSNRGGPMMIWDGTQQMIDFGRRSGETLDPAFILLFPHLQDVEGRDADNGDALYQANCAFCHGVDGEGSGAFPPLDTRKFGRISDAALDTLISTAPPPHASAPYLALSDDEKADVRLRVFGFWGTPGYYLMKPEGSAADVTTISDLDYSVDGINALTNITDSQAPDFNSRLNRYKFDQEGYCFVLMRELDTGHDDDTPFDILETYVFGVALMDNDGKNHIGNERLELVFLP